jgi:8-oxo-dGTP pyrophosphatase MutT (NUDIX family)
VVRATPRGPALVLQQRSISKATWPGAWDVSAAGHYRPDEGLAGGLREIEEELGVRVSATELVPLERHREVLRYPTGLRDREYQDVYLVRRDEPLADYRPDPREVTGLVALPAPALAALARGDVPRLLGRGWLLGPDGWSERTVRVPRARLVTRTGRYYERVARAAGRLV